MSEVTPINKIRLRYPYQRISNLVLNIWRPRIKARARVRAPFTYPLMDLPVKGLASPVDLDWQAVRRNEMFVISSGIDGAGTRRIQAFSRRFAINNGDGTGTLRMPRISEGDSGIASRYLSAIANDDYVTCFDAMGIWGVLSRIDEANPTTILKRGDLALDSAFPQTNYPSPQVIFEENGWQSGSTSSQFRAFCSGSYSWMEPPGTLTYVHSPPSGLTFASGYSATMPNVILQANADGQYLHQVTVTDSAIPPAAGAQRTGTGFRPIFVNGPNYRAFSEIYACKIISDRQDILGRVVQVEVEGDSSQNALNELMPGAMALMTYEIECSLDGNAWDKLEAGQGLRRFAGYIGDFAAVVADGRTRSLTFTIESPFVYLKRVPMAPQHLEHKNGAIQNWQQVSPLLGSIPYALYYAASWHANGFVEQNNFTRAFNGYKRSAIPIRGTNVQEAMLSIIRLVNGYCGSLSNGEFAMTENQNLSSIRTLTNQFEWTPGDLDQDRGLSVTLNSLPQIGEITGGWTWWQGGIDNAAQARYPIYSQAQGSGIEKMDDFITLNDTLGRRAVGHYFAERNRSIQSVSFPANTLAAELLEPVAQRWQLAQLSAVWEDRYMLDYAGARYTPLEVIREWSPENSGDLRISWEGKPETFGYEATILQGSTSDPPPPAPCTTTYTANLTWISVNATPDGFSELGNIGSPTGWTGDTTDIGGAYNAKRAPFTDWQNSENRKTGIRLTLCAPRRIGLLFASFNFEDDGANKRIAVAVKQKNGKMRVLYNTLHTNTSGNTSFSTPPLALTNQCTEIWLMARQYGAKNARSRISITNYNLTA